MDRYTCEEVEKMIKDWLGREVKDRVKELEEPLRKVWNSVYTYKIELNNNTGFKNLFSDTSSLFSIAEIICDGNWKSSATYIKLERGEYGTLKLKGYDRIEECPNFVLALALELYRWDKKDVDKFLKVEDEWRYSTTPSRYTTIEEFELEVYKNGEKVSEIKVKQTSWMEGEEVKYDTILEGDHANKEEGHLVIRSNYDKSPMEILNDFGYKEYEFKRM